MKIEVDREQLVETVGQLREHNKLAAEVVQYFVGQAVEAQKQSKEAGAVEPSDAVKQAAVAAVDAMSEMQNDDADQATKQAAIEQLVENPEQALLTIEDLSKRNRTLADRVVKGEVGHPDGSGTKRAEEDGGGLASNKSWQESVLEPIRRAASRR